MEHFCTYVIDDYRAHVFFVLVYLYKQLLQNIFPCRIPESLENI